jgi:hypothetical protein
MRIDDLDVTTARNVCRLTATGRYLDHCFRHVATPLQPIA